MKKKILAVAAGVCALAMTVALAGCGGGGDAGQKMRFVTGGESGTYYAYGTVLAQYATNNAGVQVSALSSEGSKANIEALQSGNAELGFCQSDVATYAYEGKSLFESPVQTFSVVGALYQEQVQNCHLRPGYQVRG